MSNAQTEAVALVAKAGMSNFVPATMSYAALSDPLYESKVVPIAEIQPIERAVGVANFGDERALSILRAIASNAPMPPIRVECLMPPVQPYLYKLHDGFHRFHLSRVLGFTHIPVGVMDASHSFDDKS